MRWATQYGKLYFFYVETKVIKVLMWMEKKMKLLIHRPFIFALFYTHHIFFYIYHFSNLALVSRRISCFSPFISITHSSTI